MMKEQKKVQKWIDQGWVRPEEFHLLNENNKPLIFKHQKTIESLLEYAFSLEQICQVTQASMSDKTNNFSQYQGIFGQKINHLMTFMQSMSEGESSRYDTLWRMGIDEHALLAFATSHPQEAAFLSSKHLQVIRQYIEKGRSFSEIHRLFDAGVFSHVDEPAKRDFSGRKVLFERQIMAFPLYVDLVEAYQFVHKHQHDGRGFLPMTLERATLDNRSLGGGIGWVRYGKTLEGLHGLTGKTASPSWGSLLTTLTQTFMSFMADDLRDVCLEYGEKNALNQDQYYYLDGMALCHTFIARGVDANQLFEVLKECARRVDDSVHHAADLDEHLHQEAQDRADRERVGKLRPDDLPIFPLQSKYSIPPFFRFILPALLDLGIPWEDIKPLIYAPEHPLYFVPDKKQGYFAMWDSHFCYSILRWAEAFGSLSDLSQQDFRVRRDLIASWENGVQPCIDHGLSAEETIKVWKIQARLQKAKPGQINGFMQTVLDFVKQGVSLDDLLRWSGVKLNRLTLVRHALGLMMTKSEEVTWPEHFENFDAQSFSISQFLQAGWHIKDGTIHLKNGVISQDGQNPIRIDPLSGSDLLEAYCQWIMGGLSHRQVWSLLLAYSGSGSKRSVCHQGDNSSVYAHLTALFKNFNHVIPSNSQLLSHLTIDQLEYLKSKVSQACHGKACSQKAIQHDLLQAFSTLMEKGIAFEKALEIFRIGRQKAGAGMYCTLSVKIATNLVKLGIEFNNIYGFFKKVLKEQYGKDYIQWLDFFTRRSRGKDFIDAFHTYRRKFLKRRFRKRAFMSFGEDQKRWVSGLLARHVPVMDIMGVSFKSVAFLFPKKDWVIHVLRLIRWGIPFKTLQQLASNADVSPSMKGVTCDDLEAVCRKLGISQYDLETVKIEDALAFYKALYVRFKIRFLEHPFHQIRSLKAEKVEVVVQLTSSWFVSKKEIPYKGVQLPKETHAVGVSPSSYLEHKVQ